MDRKVALAEAVAALHPGDKIAAIKLIRTHIPAFGLKEAKEFIDEAWRRAEGQFGPRITDIVLSLLPDTHFSGEPPPSPRVSALPPDWKREIERFRPDQKILAVKYVRDKTGLGLKEAKDMVEQAWEDEPKPAARWAPKAAEPPGGGAPDYEVRSSGLPLQWIALAVAAAAGAWYFFGR